jgi:hypothetical protein
MRVLGAQEGGEFVGEGGFAGGGWSVDGDACRVGDRDGGDRLDMKTGCRGGGRRTSGWVGHSAIVAYKSVVGQGGNRGCRGGVQAGMPKRRVIVMGVVTVVVVAAAVVVGVVATGQTRPACGCTIEPDIRRPAQAAAVRFEGLVRQGDVAGAWGLLTGAAQTRYVNPAGFQPVVERLAKALHESEADTEEATAGWRVVHERFDTPSEAVVVRVATGPLRVVWPLLALVPSGREGDTRVDPEVPVLPVTASADGDGVRVELADADLTRISYTAIDENGLLTLPGRESISAHVDRLKWPRALRLPVVAIAIERSGTGLRVGAATVTR